MKMVPYQASLREVIVSGGEISKTAFCPDEDAGPAHPSGLEGASENRFFGRASCPTGPVPQFAAQFPARPDICGCCLMLDHEPTMGQDLLLRDADYPRDYTIMQHPEDYITRPTPVTEFIDHVKPYHNRMIVRISWRKPEDEVISMSFICDTGAPMGFYLSGRARAVLEEIGRI